jgi:hypothetical protein
MSEAALIASMMGLNVNVGVSGGLWTPEPKQFSPEIGSSGAAIGPPQVLAAVSPDAEQAARPRRRRAGKPRRGEIVEAPIASPTQNPLTSDTVLVPPPLAGPASAATQGPVVPPPEGAKAPGAKP